GGAAVKAAIHRNRILGPRRCRGLSLVEVVISLAISAMLLTAVAAAFSASANAIEIKDQFFRATQAARVSLNQVLTEVRRSKACSVSPSSKKIDMITYDDKDRTYSYNNGTGCLMLITNDITTDPDYKMCSNITSYSCDADTVTDAN